MVPVHRKRAQARLVAERETPSVLFQEMRESLCAARRPPKSPSARTCRATLSAEVPRGGMGGFED
jgi:hypothetical protein